MNIYSQLNLDTPIPKIVLQNRVGQDLTNFIIDHRTELEADLCLFGAILFRGFQINSVDAFDAVVDAFGDSTVPYIFRSTPRHSLNEKIHVSTTYPPSRPINMHSESSYNKCYGKKIMFCCLQSATKGGQTPIADNRKVLSRLSPEIVDKFSELGILYRRKISANFGLTWQETFQTSDFSEIENVCEELSVRIDSVSDSSLELSWNRPAIITHNVTKDQVWFNHAYFFNKFNIIEELGLSFDDTSIYPFLPYDTFFGDGSTISYNVFSQIQDAYLKEKVFFDWQAGDLLLLDNILMAHGREPFSGVREILVSILDPTVDE